ncbi:MAG: type IV secretory system conjugative DNA transfer family protein [Allomuricauda sp.]
MTNETQIIIGCLVLWSIISFGTIRYIRFGFFIMMIGLLGASILLYHGLDFSVFTKVLLYFITPALFIIVVLYGYLDNGEESSKSDKKYRMTLHVKGSKCVLDNIRRGVSVIGAAGSGKTESVIYNFLSHFQKQEFCGVMHDYKKFELTEMAYPLFKNSSIDFYVIAFDPIYHRVNPIAPRYLPDEESVYEISRVLLENLLEMRDEGNSTSRFFKDAVEGLISGLVWRLKTDYKSFCTIPHLIALYQFLDIKGLENFLKANLTSKAMASAFLDGITSDRQTAGVMSTLANAFKKISTKRIFKVLSADDVPLNINSPENPAVISIVNNPKKETSLSPVIATIMHTVTKQMSERGMQSSFVLLEEAPTIRLLNMHRIPATLRSYDIMTLYVLQDKIQNDMMYGDKASKAILANLSYQFFGKANDPDTAKYYERFFEIVKKQTRSINKGFNLNFDTRVTQSEKEVAKTRADAFYGLKQGEFIVFADGKDQKIQFRRPQIKKELPPCNGFSQQDLDENFKQIHKDIKSMFS